MNYLKKIRLNKERQELDKLIIDFLNIGDYVSGTYEKLGKKINTDANKIRGVIDLLRLAGIIEVLYQTDDYVFYKIREGINKKEIIRGIQHK
ncbi:hypothetical protein [Caldanaerobacter subterraneus]|uniref:Uncharacterized protein n=1 Tax=Caldanaerobacter subterraneus TaxID=911092 RepID=A0A7Y2L6J1_9THEO|nr:hypothetical protein [Caldanaerobacter subterraneus]NNG66157.1 hypothetical protein [Caldanaerobacter subterraneus]